MKELIVKLIYIVLSAAAVFALSSIPYAVANGGNWYGGLFGAVFPVGSMGIMILLGRVLDELKRGNRQASLLASKNQSPEHVKGKREGPSSTDANK